MTPAMIAFHRERALGGMVLIIVEYTCIAPDTGRCHWIRRSASDTIQLWEMCKRM